MSSENVQPIIRSYALASRFQNGRIVSDRLRPPAFRKLPTLYQKCWREEPLSTGCDWGVTNFSYLIPESVTILSSLFLRIELPALTAGKFYKTNPALYCIKDFKLLSGGNVVYTQDMDACFRDCLESMTEEEYINFSEAHLGYESTPSHAARSVYINLPLPNSHINLRHGSSDRGLGVFPCELERVRLEVQFSLHANDMQATDSTVDTGSIAGRCTICMREVKMSDANAQNYRNKVGEYSVVTRRFQEISPWTQAAANTPVVITLSSPQGNVSEFQIIAVPYDADSNKRNQYSESVLASSLEMQCDGIIVRDFDRPEKVLMHNYSEGFQNHTKCKAISRICFGSHSSESSTTFTGAMNFRNTSQTKLTVKFPVAAEFRVVAVQLMSVQIESTVVAVQLMSVQIESTGQVKAYLD
jgi:hypothetical protein